MSLSATSGQQVATPTIDGGARVLTASTSMSSAQATTTPVDVSQTNLISIRASRFGTLASETLTLQLSFDGGLNFADFKTYTLAQVNVPNSFCSVEQIKATHARFVLNSPQVGSGLNVRMFV